MEINHWVKAKAKGELRVPHCTLDAKNLYLSKTDIWEYQYQERDFSTGWAKVEESFLGKEWEAETKSVRGVGQSKLVEGSISKFLFFFFNDQALS